MFYMPSIVLGTHKKTGKGQMMVTDLKKFKHSQHRENY